MQADEITRHDRIVANGGEPALPELGEVFYLADTWADIGIVSAGASGPARLTAAEIVAWQQCSGRCLNPWEFSVVRDMSSAYLSGNRDGEEPECAPPFGPTEQEYDREVISKRIGSVFGALARKPS